MNAISRLRLIIFAALLLIAGAQRAESGITIMRRAGSWADVVRHPEGFALVRADHRTLVAELPTRELWRLAMPESILYLQADTCGGSIAVVAQGHDTGRSLLLRQSGVTPLGPNQGQNSIAIRGCTVYAQIAPDTYEVISLTGAPRRRVSMPWTSQGFRDITPAGEVRLGDQWFIRVVRGHSLHQPQERGGVWVGQWSNAFGVGMVMPDRAFTVIPELAFEPQEEQIGDTFGVAARTLTGAVLAIVSPPYPADVGVNPPPPPPPPPPPLPELPAAVCDRLKAERSQFPELIENDAQLGEILNNTAWAFRAQGFGLSGKDFGTHCPSKAGKIACDILHRSTDNVLWDVIGGAGAGFPSGIQCGAALGPPPGSNRPFVAPADPGGAPPPPPPPPPDKLEARVRLLEQKVTDLRERLIELDQRTNSRVDELTTVVTALEQRPTPSFDEARVRAMLDESLQQLRVKGQTGRDRLGLRHEVDLPVVVVK